jgi:hypothetical protein
MVIFPDDMNNKLILLCLVRLVVLGTLARQTEASLDRKDYIHSLDLLAAKSLCRNLDMLNIMLSFSGRRLLGQRRKHKMGKRTETRCQCTWEEVSPSPTIIAGAANFELKNEAHTSELKEIPMVVATSATESDLASLLNMRLIPRRTTGSVKLVVFDLEARSSRRSACRA